jgi:photosystem II stability/assembly factor-like uncharacterized protein
MAEEMLRRNLENAFDPGPDFPDRLLLSRTMAMLEKEIATGHRAIAAPSGLRPGLRLVAAAMVLLVALAAAGAILAAHDFRRPAPAHFPPYRILSPGAILVCSGDCYVAPAEFPSASVGWVAETIYTSPNGCGATCPTRSVLFGTNDGGHIWTPRFTWQMHSPQQILSSSDGRHVLIVGDMQDAGASLFHSSDGGATWNSHSLPSGAGTAKQTSCKGGFCGQTTVSAQVFFRNADEGWVVSQEPSLSIAGVFHTTDAGAHWTRTARIDVKAQFGLDLVTGITYPNSAIDHSLPGQFFFESATSGWYVTTNSSFSGTPPFLYRTVDGGATWQLQTLPTAPGLTLNNAFVGTFRFFDQSNGVLELGTANSSGPSATYASITTDGGAHWSDPIKLPTEASIHFIDATHWVGWPYAGGWMTTADSGFQWTVIPGATTDYDSAPVANAGLPRAFPSRSFDFLDPEFGWAYVSVAPPDGSASGLALYQTTDGGVNWTPMSLPQLTKT